MTGSVKIMIGGAIVVPSRRLRATNHEDPRPKPGFK
jgi:hypothetical protein